MDRLTKRQANVHSTVIKPDLFQQDDIKKLMGKNHLEEIPKHISFVDDDMSEMYEYIGEV